MSVIWNYVANETCSLYGDTLPIFDLFEYLLIHATTLPITSPLIYNQRCITLFEINQFKDIPLHSVLNFFFILIIKHLKISFLCRLSLIDIYIILFFAKFTVNIFSSVFSLLLHLIYSTCRSLHTIFSSYI